MNYAPVLMHMETRDWRMHNGIRTSWHGKLFFDIIEDLFKLETILLTAKQSNLFLFDKHMADDAVGYGARVTRKKWPYIYVYSRWIAQRTGSPVLLDNYMKLIGSWAYVDGNQLFWHSLSMSRDLYQCNHTVKVSPKVRKKVTQEGSNW